MKTYDDKGQIEIFINSDSMTKIIESLKKNLKFTGNFVAVELFDSFLAYDSANFISACLTALTSMINLELPHINVYSCFINS